MSKKEYYPAMHTAEHILNQTMHRMFNCGRAIATHIERKKSKCDYLYDKELTESEIQAVEDMVNKIIARHLEITEEFISLQNAEKEYNLSKLPDDASKTIRIVKIGDYDSCPCIGQHVNNTAEIGTFKISSYDFVSGRVRIRFKLFKD